MNRALAAGLAVALLLTGCAAEAPPVVQPSTPPVTSPTPTPTPTVEPVSRPVPLLDTSCDALAASADFSTYVGEPVSRDAQAARAGIDYSIELEQLGGFSCRWSNDAEPGTREELSIDVAVLPKAGYKWTRYADAYDFTSPYYYCYDYEKADDQFFCGYIALINDAWVEFYLGGHDQPGVVGDKAVRAKMKPLFTALVGVIESAAQVDEPWSPPATALPLPTECPEFVTAKTIAKATGASNLETFTYRDGPQVGMTLDKELEPLVKSCSFLFKNSDAGVGGLSALPGGEWAFDEYAGSSPSADLIELSTLPGGTVYRTCENSMCSVDFVVGGNWVSVRVANYEYSEHTIRDLPGSVVTIAEVIAKNLG